MGKIYLLPELMRERAAWKSAGKRVVFTNGVFDILHRGHAEYLAASKSLGDILVVGVNSDESVKRIKGPLRPVVPQNDRAYLISQLVSVDAVCLFEQDTPYDIISAVVPDYLVKGSDWSVDAVVGKDVVEAAGGRVLTIPLIPNCSTTNIIATIQQRFESKTMD
jgi:D-glycero-beta-D-manno-heptose 1-phosphate adenylyltransferase